MAISFFAFCCCHVRSAKVLAFVLLRRYPVRSSSLDDPIRQGTFTRCPATSIALLRVMCVEEASDIELLREILTGQLRPMAAVCVWVLVEADFYWPPVPPFWPFLPLLQLRPGSPVLLGSPTPCSGHGRPCTKPSVSNKSSPEATEDLVSQVTFDVCPPPVAAFLGGRAWKMPTEIDARLQVSRLVAQCSDRPQGPWQKAYKYPSATHIRVIPTWCRSSWALVPYVPRPRPSAAPLRLRGDVVLIYTQSSSCSFVAYRGSFGVANSGTGCCETLSGEVWIVVAGAGVDRKRWTGGRSRTHDASSWCRLDNSTLLHLTWSRASDEPNAWDAHFL